MQQWYKCPNCNQDILYGTSPCPSCRCFLAWSQQGPTVYVPPIEASRHMVAQSDTLSEEIRHTGSEEPINKSKIARLARVSDAFINHITSHTLVKNEWVPCPQCGQGNVDAPAGKAIGCLAGSAMIIWYIIFTLFAAIVVGIFFWPLSIGIIIGGIIGAFLLPLLGTALGLVYRCKSCNYAWTFGDIESYKSGLSNRS
jgi:hypothetical protein